MASLTRLNYKPKKYPITNPATGKFALNRPTQLRVPPGQKLLSISKIGDLLAGYRKVLVNLLLISTLLVVTTLAIIEVLHQKIVIEPIGIPKVLSDMGYSEDNVAHRLMDAIEEIYRKSTTAKKRMLLVPESRQIDITVPETKISLKSIAHMLRRFFKTNDIKIAGEFVCATYPCKPDNLSLRLRVVSQTREIVDIDHMKHGASKEYFEASALSLMQLIDPYVVASFHYAKKEFAVAQRMAEQIILGRKNDREWAYNLLASIKHEKGDPVGAIQHYESALNVDPNFHLARANMAHSLIMIGDLDGAIMHNRQVLRSEPENVRALTGWGIALLGKGEDYDGAVEQFKKALAKDPAFVPAHAGLAGVHIQNYDYASAIVRLNIALTFLSDSASKKNVLLLRRTALEALAKKHSSTGH